MRRTVLAFVTLSLLAGGVAHGQFTLINNRVSNITGTGARAMGMGGAFVALADDATAASWNPAGLAQLTRPEVSLVYDWSSGSYDVATTAQDTYPNGDAYFYTQSNPGHLSSSYLSFASATYPFIVKGHRLVAQISYNRMAGNPDLTTSALEKAKVPGSDQYEDFLTARTSDRWSGGYDAYSISLASELGSHVRVGISIDYIDASLGERFTEDFEVVGFPSAALTYTAHDDSSFSAWRGDVGIQWTPVERLTFGAVYHSSFTATFEDASRAAFVFEPDFWGQTLPSSPASADYRTRVHWPEAYQLGVAWRATDRLILAVDYGVTRWSSAKLDSFEAPCWDADNNPSPCVAQDFPYPSGAKQHDSQTVRAGGEYTFYLGKRVFMPVRAGYFRDRQLAAMSGVPGTTSAPTFNSYTLGAGLAAGHFQFDVAWVKTKGDQSNTASSTSGDVQTVQSGKAALDTDRYIASMIVRF